ncbi:methyl-accepting chemotaxis protein [Oricola cellulosilytica]|uniref:Methyl-accepting chemotaxis protein n=2 Tax=Oricola cellulosilytica TaxID=1429082 RepID=A0A4R0P2B9_9HYPH|nr:methyl-accepting chemotaxis protein [Oricola cellulosilytica]TCD10965.1 methyl-accepting chemotaxis protein [Oricola cellulosilytica]
MKLSKFKIGAKFAVTFALLIGMFLAIAGTAFMSLRTIEEADGWNVHTYNVLGHSDTLIASVVNQETGVRGYLVSGDENFLEPYIAGKADFQKALKTLLEITSDNPAQQARLQKVGQLENDWRTEIAEREIALMKNPATVEQAREIEASGAGKGLMDALRAAHAEFDTAESSLLVSRTATKDNASAFAEWAIVLGSLFIVAIASVLGFVLTRHVGSAVSSLTEVMRKLAAGDNSVDVPFEGRGDEIGEMAQSVLVFKNAAIEKDRMEREADENRNLTEKERAEREAAKAAEAATLNEAIEALAGGLQQLSEGNLTARIDKPFTESLDRLRVDFNESVEKLAETLSEVKVNIDTIHANAGEMRTAVESLSSRTEQQAAALEETSASLEEITSTVKSSSERAQEATTKAAEAKSASDSSTKVVSDAVEAMGRIENASGEIAKIIGVIDEIAFQTNLLALNAGVEAARAGEAGKGFAVVAQEVRELAQRSASAAKEIKDLIGKSTDEVESGVELVKATGEALTKIAEQVTDISDHIASIATAAREQSTGLQEVNAAVGQMDQVTQQNAAMVEETTAVTHRLASDADGLTALVGRFTMAGGKASASRPAAANDENDAPVKSPAKSMMSKVKRAFSGNAAVAEEWEDF